MFLLNRKGPPRERMFRIEKPESPLWSVIGKERLFGLFNLITDISVGGSEERPPLRFTAFLFRAEYPETLQR
jgi:hypothetical protein